MHQHNVKKFNIKMLATDIHKSYHIYIRTSTSYGPSFNTPQIGHQHGTAATLHISRSITFYASLFLDNCKQTWPQVLSHAALLEQTIRQKWPAYHDEMRGIADGSGRSLLDIVAL